MAKQFTEIKRPLQKWEIDRLEEGWAVLICAETLETITLPKANLPKGARAGDTLVKHGSAWYKDAADTADRAERIKARFERIKAANRGDG